MPALEALLRRDRWIVGAGLAVICAISWGYVLSGAGTGMNVLNMTTWQFPPPVTTRMHGTAEAWSAGYWTTMIVMWWVMMIAMMVPSAAPMILLHARVFRHGQKRGQIPGGPVPTLPFVSGYLLAWLGFSIATTALQWALERAGLMNALMMWSTSAALTGTFLIAAGVYQLSPLKHVCLNHCRSPADFLSRHWRKGAAGTWRMGVDHGLYCVGCCWFLMALLFAGGVMNLVWIAGLAILVLAEKIAPRGDLIAKCGGGAMALAGIWVIFS